MTAFGLCCFWPGKNIRSRHHGDIDRRGTVSPVDDTPDAVHVLEALEEHEWPVGESDQACLVKCGNPLLRPGERTTPYSDILSCAVPECKGKGRHRRPDSRGADGNGVSSSSSLTEPLMESCSVNDYSSSDDEEHSYALRESYHWEGSSNPQSVCSEVEVTGSRFVSIEPSSKSMSESDDSLLLNGPSAAQELEQIETDSMSVNSGWSTTHESSMDGGHIPPVHRFHKGQNRFDEDDVPLSSDSDGSSIVCQGDRANELQDAINFALKDVEGLSGCKQKLGARILAALRDMKTSHNVGGDGLPPQQSVYGCEPGPCCSGSTRSAQFGEGSSCRERSRGMSVKDEANCSQELDLVAWIANSIQQEEKEDERGVSIASRGTSIILPVPFHHEEQESIDLVALQAACENSAIGRELLLHLENRKWRSSSPSSGSGPSKVLSHVSEPIQAEVQGQSQSCGSKDLCEDDIRSPLASCLGSTFVCENETEEEALEGADGIHHHLTKKEQTDNGLLFDTAKSLVDQARQGVHDSAVTMVSCNYGTAGCSPVSELSERPGTSWLLSDASGSLCFQPSLPLSIEERDAEEPKDPPECVKSGSRSRKASSDGSGLENFYDCIPEPVVAEAVTSLETASPDMPTGAVSAVVLPELKLNQLHCYELKPRPDSAPCGLLTKDLPNMPEMTPRSLERWQLGLKLIWMGEDDDDLVAEVRHGSSFIFGTPRMPKVPKENEPADPGESSSPVSTSGNSPVNVPVKSPAWVSGADCAATRFDGELGKPDVARATADGEKTEKMKSAVKESVEQAREVLHVVDQMLSGLKSARRSDTGHAIVASEDLGMKPQTPPQASTVASPVQSVPRLSNTGRKKATLQNMKSQLEKLEELVAFNASRLRPNGTGSETARRAELEWAILQDVRTEVDRLEMELMNNSSPSPTNEGHNFGSTQPQDVSCRGYEEPFTAKDGSKGQMTQKPASHNIALSNKWKIQFPKVPGLRSCDDIVLKRRKAVQCIRRNPRAAGLAHNRHRSHRGHAAEGRAGGRADRATVIEGLRKAQIVLSERMGNQSRKVLSVRIPDPVSLSKRAYGEGANEESLSNTPTLQPAPPDLCRKGTVVGATADAAGILRGEEHTNTSGSPAEKSPTLKSKSTQQSKMSIVNKGVGSGKVRRIFLTF